MAMESDNMDQVGRAIKDVLTACSNTRGIRVDKLSTFDIEYLFLHVRGKSVGETIEVMATCPDDGETKVAISVSIDEIGIIENPEHNKDIKLDDKKFNQTLAIDLPHHGYSTGSKLTTIEEYAEGIENVLGDMDLSNFHLCGHSMGGLIALRLAFNEKLQFKSVNILNASCPMFVGGALLDDSRKNLDSAMDMLTTYGVNQPPKAKASGPICPIHAPVDTPENLASVSKAISLP